MFRQRLITAAVLVPLVVCAVLLMPGPLFSAVLAVVLLITAREWMAMVPFRTLVPQALFLLSLLAGMVAAWYALDWHGAMWLLLAALGWWCVVMLWLSRPQWGAQGGRMARQVKLVAGLLVLLSAWVALSHLHAWNERGPQWLLYLLVLIWVADSGAYFCGRRWGRRKLAPSVSPGKTWEGVFGALAAVAVFAVAGAGYFELDTDRAALFVLLSGVTAAISIVGDLQVSLLKRQCGLKDSGKLLPGHGGLLDRLDSLLSASPVFVLGLNWIML